MILFGAVAVAACFGTGVYLLLSFNVQRIAFGFLLLSNGVNLLILTGAGFRPGAEVPIIEDGGAPLVDPLPHAFLLTAIVIGFAATALLLVLAERTHRAGVLPPGASPDPGAEEEA